ncbi:MAG: T9SS type A sorting domain-containing protein [Candidatus Cloacimonetes bacterium]|nr:T9SS type A sorting domain-containing protein [Candidatus Cloacimonadota bacterium]
MSRKIILFCILFIAIFIYSITNSLLAKYLDIPVTRNLEPERFKPCSFEEYQNKHLTKPTNFYEIRRFVGEDRDTLNFLIFVDSTLYPLIEAALSTYQNDLLNENTNSFLVSFSGTSAEDLKSIILDYYNSDNIVGVILIGDLPSAWFEMYEDFDNNGIPDGDLVEFPIDLYFSDLDGQWLDLDFNGIYEIHWGSVHPDIWIGRIKADNLDYSNDTEAELLNNYFSRNHLFRTGVLENPNNALAYIDDDWADWGPEYQSALEYIYPEVELINDINETTAEDYRTNRLPADYEFIQVHVHSSPMAHYFYQNNGSYYQLVHNYELPIINPKAYFYNLFACSNAHFETDNNMGSLYLLADDFCLGTIGSTKTGSMLFFEYFYEPLSLENTMGEAFKLWWIENVDTGQNNWWERSWFYGMVILGDPTLKFHYNNAIHVSGDVSGEWNVDTVYVDGEINIPLDSTLIIEPGVQVLFSDHYKFNIYGRILGEGTESDTITFTAQDTTIGWHGLRFHNTNENGQDSSKIVYCKLEYGFAWGDLPDDCGGAIYFNNSSNILIKECLITQNIALNGAGIFCHQSSPSLTNVLMSRNVCYDIDFSHGGGICCEFDSNPNLANVTISENRSYFGGGLYCNNSSPTLNDVTIMGNMSAPGGGILCEYNSNLSLTNVTIIENTAFFGSGGGIFCGNSSLVLTNGTISNNIASLNGGGIESWNSSINLTNVIISGNTADDDGGGISCSQSTISLTNVTISGNIAFDEGGGIRCASASVILVNCILWNDSPQEIYFSSFGDPNSITISYSDVQGGEGGIVTNNNGTVYWDYFSNINSDPFFVDANSDNFHLTEGSPCIDTGTPDTTGLNLPPWDLDGNERIWDGDEDGIAIVDMGCYEFDAPPYVSIDDEPKSPILFKLYQNYPNPFSSSTTISFHLATIPNLIGDTNSHEQTLIEIYNVKGQLIRTFRIPNPEFRTPNIVWDGKDENGKPVSSGIYFYQLRMGKGFSQTKKLLLLK